MFPKPYNSWFTVVALTGALGILFLSTRRLILLGGLYDLELIAPTSMWDHVIEYLAFCGYSACLLLAYHLLSRKRTTDTDASLAEFCLTLFLGLGAQLGILSTLVNGWRIGMSYFACGGLLGAALGFFMGIGALLIIRGGQKLEAFFHHGKKG